VIPTHKHPILDDPAKGLLETEVGTYAILATLAIAVGSGFLAAYELLIDPLFAVALSVFTSFVLIFLVIARFQRDTYLLFVYALIGINLSTWSYLINFTFSEQATDQGGAGSFMFIVIQIFTLYTITKWIHSKYSKNTAKLVNRVLIIGSVVLFILLTVLHSILK